MIKEGDIVTLKSGSPKMTVGKIYKWSKEASCYYNKESSSTWRISDTVAESHVNTYIQHELIHVSALELAS